MGFLICPVIIFIIQDTKIGEQVGSGVYFYQLRAGDYTDTRKMVILK